MLDQDHCQAHVCAADLGVNHVPYNVVQFQECAMEWGWGGVRNSIAVLEGNTKWGGGGGGNGAYNSIHSHCSPR